MDGFNEKKWFVYLGDHHEGPFSLAEMQSRMNAGQVTTLHYVWCEGMADWLPMTEVSAFDSVIQARNAAVAVATNQPTPAQAANSMQQAAQPAYHAPEPEPAPAPAPAPDISGSVLSAAAAPASASASAKSASPSIIVQSAHEVSRPIILSAVSQSSPALAGLTPIGLGSTGGIPQRPIQLKPIPEKKSAGLLVKAVVIVILGSIGGLVHSGFLSSGVSEGKSGFSLDSIQPMLLSLTDKIPFLSSWISPIPDIPEVTPEHYQELRAAASQSLGSGGPAVAFVPATTSLEAPVFYIATNLPDGARFDLTIDGIAGTLLGTQAVSLKIQAVAQQRWVKTDPLRFPDGRPIPRGEYKVKLTDSAAQVEPVQAVLASVQAKPKLARERQLFLGGARDAVYASRLKEIIDELKKRAQTEITEIEQFTTTLESQLNVSVQTFTNVRKKMAPRTMNAAKKDWANLQGWWKPLMVKLNEAFSKWNPASLQNDFYYGGLYGELPKIAQAIEKVHQHQDAFVLGQIKDPGFETSLGQEVTAAQTLLTGLRARINKVKSAPPAPNGVPQKEVP